MQFFTADMYMSGIAHHGHLTNTVDPCGVVLHSLLVHNHLSIVSAIEATSEVTPSNNL